MRRKRKKPHLALVSSGSGIGSSGVLSHESAGLLLGLGPVPLPSADARDKLSIVYSAPAERRFGHADVTEEGFDISEERRRGRTHDAQDIGRYPTRQWETSLSRVFGDGANLRPMPGLLRDRFRERMDAQGFTKRSLSLAAGLGATAVRDILDGQPERRKGDKTIPAKTPSTPSVDTLQALATQMKTTVAYLIGETDVADAIFFGPESAVLDHAALAAESFRAGLEVAHRVNGNHSAAKAHPARKENNKKS